MKKIVLAVLCFMSFLPATRAVAKENWYFIVDQGLREVYEYFEGITLEEAIDNIIADQNKRSRNEADIEMRFNDGFKLSIGQKNTLQIKVKNKAKVRAISLGFNIFLGSGNIKWRDGYGTITPDSSPINNILRINQDAFEGCFDWKTSSTMFDYPNEIYIIGEVKDKASSCTLPIHYDGAITLYSMQIELPDDSSLSGQNLYVAPKAFSPTLKWSFTDSEGHEYAPYFQGVPTFNMNKPEKGPVIFEITADPLPGWDVDKEKQKLGKAALRDNYDFLRKMDESINNGKPKRITDPERYYGLIYRDGVRLIMAKMDYEGPDEDLLDLGVRISPFRPWGSPLSVSIPLSRLPQVCQLEGVKFINPVTPGYPHLE